MTCLSPRTILLLRTTQSNLKFQCKIHERTRGPVAGGLEYFHDTTFQNTAVERNAHVRDLRKRGKNKGKLYTKECGLNKNNKNKKAPENIR